MKKITLIWILTIVLAALAANQAKAAGGGTYLVCCSATDVVPPGNPTCNWVTGVDACAVDETMPCTGNQISAVINKWTAFHSVPGSCIQGCVDPYTQCDASYGPICVDTSNNNEYCGDCYTHCQTGETCVNGYCEVVGGGTNCLIDTVTLSPGAGCVGNMCGIGSTLSVQVSFVPDDCYYLNNQPLLIYTSASSADGTCTINIEGGSMSGMFFPLDGIPDTGVLGAGGVKTYNYHITDIPAECTGKTLTDLNVEFDSPTISTTVASRTGSASITLGQCGNDVINPPEQCDGTDLGDSSCELKGYGPGTLSCKADCTFDFSECSAPASCGDGICQSGENAANCVKDCLDGWHTQDDGWSKNSANRLVGTSPDESAIDIVSDGFDLRLGRNYTLSAIITNTAGCGFYIDLNGGKCLSNQTFLEQDCFQSDLFRLNQTGAVNKRLPATDPDSLQGYFRNVSVRIHVDPDCQATFDNISIKEVSDINAQQPGQPDINLTTSCCPREYCWDGSQCVPPADWISSKNPNVWSDLDINSLTKQHVLTSQQWLAKGYRCVLNDTGDANWEKAQIKYDWDFEESGYCMHDTDCFVRSYEDGTPYDGYGGSSCIRSRQFMNDDRELGKGNHYCMDGEWTTKTYLIANALENISDGKPYVLFCDDSGSIFNDAIQGVTNSGNYIAGGCVIIIKDSANDESVITGFYAANTNYSRDDSWTAEDIMCTVMAKHISAVTGEGTTCEQASVYVDPTYIGCDTFGNPIGDFRRCAKYDAPNQGLYIYFYYNEAYNESYYLASDKPISKIEEGWLQQVWNWIITFFGQLFGYIPSQPLGLAAQTSNYERLYILQNHTLNVTAVEENKYDEQVAQQLVYMYLNMTNPGLAAGNPFNITFINQTMQGRYYDYSQSPDSQVLLIKYSQPAELWPYLTAMLRDRP